VKKSEREALKKYKMYQRALKNIKGDKGEAEEAEYVREKMDVLRPHLPKSEQRKIEENSPLCKIIKYLTRFTTVPIEKSGIQWRIDTVFNFYRFETEVKGKIYVFDGRHFMVYPAGYELPPGIRIGDKSGPDILLNVKINMAPKLFGELWMQVCGQHEKEIAEDQVAREREVEITKKTQEEERKRVLENTKRILDDFRRKQDF